MSFADTLKGLIFKKPATAEGRDTRDPRRTDEPLEGGRRKGEAEAERQNGAAKQRHAGQFIAPRGRCRAV